MKKAITPVISVILLIMLVVAITGGAWYWMTNVQGSLQESAGANIEQTSDLSSTSFSIVSVQCNSSVDEAVYNDVVTLSILNTGSEDIPSTSSWIITASTIGGITLGSNATVGDVIDTVSSGSASQFVVDGGFGNITAGSSYSIKVNVGSSSQTTTCTAS